jgi:putative ABC transport system permease protein
MNPLQTLNVAIRALSRNKLRALLTTLGIVIGVSAVIAMVAIGEGAKASVEASFASMGSNVLIVLPGSTTAGGSRGGFGSLPTLTWDDLRAIHTELPTVRYAAAQLRTTAQVMFEDQNWTTSVIGTSPEYFSIRNWPASQGASMTDADADGGVKVAFLGQTVVDKLFGQDADAVGQAVRIKNIPFQVGGVLAKKGQSPTGQDYDDAVFIPLKTFQTKIQGGLQNYIGGTIFVGATSTADTSRAQLQITALLRDRHRIASAADDDFSIRNLTELAGAQEEGTRTLGALLASIAAVSLLVGGIGVMNVMLVSVTERTREIGVRMAVGAKPHHVLAQFLVEALALSVAGGLLGLALGVGAALRLAAQFGWPTLIRPEVVLLAVCFSATVGIVFGLYPARKASLLDPIEALRYE